ncbi:unnamed protein product [Mycena citricolor]|uniref:Uncharacterized protein n=1 Tax=Mycena citricolor TaxID=2018698 RepID=A0AAD2HC88_9AGAR|nr:unnamed protein product [Mycena citricolor]
MQFRLVLTLLAVAASCAAVPIPEVRAVSPYETRFIERTPKGLNRLRRSAAGLVSRIPGVAAVRREEKDDIFLARALEDPIFASAQDFVARR